MFDKILEVINGKKVLILGYGREGRSTLSFILDYATPESLAVADKNDISIDLPKGVKAICGEAYLDALDKYDVIIKSPGIVFLNMNAQILDKTTSQTDLFLREFSPRTVGITGTKGKSTTTTLIHHILKSSGMNAVLTGNIGIPPLDSARRMGNDSIAIFEMSCHQLEFEKISPHIAVVLNLFEDHLDHYGTRENYIRAKENIFLNQSVNDILFISSNCCEQQKKAQAQVYELPFDIPFIIPKDEISLVGEHNYYNISAAWGVCSILGVSNSDFTASLKTYNPLPHRLEFVAEVNGVKYYDDSISTVCQTAIQAVSSLDNVGSIILGGMDRGIDYTELVDFLALKSVENIILCYESGKRIEKMLQSKGIMSHFVNNLADAVTLASKITKKGKKCVLSPAAASYGYFKNFEERGEVFKELVKKLPGGN